MRRRTRSSSSGSDREPPELVDPEEVEWDHGPPDRPPRSQNRDQYSLPYDRWTPDEYVFYAGQGYHRGYYDPFLGSESSDEGARGRHSGRGPRGYRRSDERIREDVNERLTFDGEVDATEILVRVENGEVTLEGTVGDRHQKRRAEDLAASARGVRDVHNRLIVAPAPTQDRGSQPPRLRRTVRRIART
jgi:BON domain-containing protein